MRKPNILRFFMFFSLGIVIFSILLVLLLHFEEKHPGTSIKNWKDGLWYSVVTLTTVGYGDLVPATSNGRVVGTIFILFSMGLYGLLIGQFASLISSIRENRKLGMNGTTFTHHVVIIGWTDFGKAVTDQLVAAGRKVAIVTTEKDNVDLIRENYKRKQVFVLFSDFNSVEMLQKVNIAESSIVFVNLNDDTEKLVYILNLKKYFTDLTYIVTLENANLKSTFLSAGVTYAVSKHEISSKLLASYIFEPDVAQYSEEIISYAESDEHLDIKQFKVTEDNSYIGMSYDDVFFALKKECNAILIGIVKCEGSKRKLYKNPESKILVHADDYLIMISNGKAVSKISNLFGVKEGIE